MILAFILIIVGLAALIYSADLLVQGSASIAKKLGIPSLVIGLTIVSFGTSAPELIVNLFSAFQGTSDIAIGNIVGSNIANILLILGVTSIVATLSIQESTVYKEIPFALLASLVLLVLANDTLLNESSTNILSRGDGLILLSFFAVFMYYIYGLATKNKDQEVEEAVDQSSLKSTIQVIIGILGLFIGGKVLVDNAVLLAEAAGLSEILIASSIIAIGTSLPELATSLVAAKKGESDIAVGNIIGSNIFNIFWILGLTSLVKPLPISDGLNFDLTVESIATLLLFIAIFAFTKHKLSRGEGILFVIAYMAYMTFIIYRG